MTQIPERQTALLLHAARQPYNTTPDHPTPQTQGSRELLVKTETIGLNPIDWKAPDFNFGLPTLPYIAGRELVGKVAKIPETGSRFQEGDRILVISTDYRDLRRAAYQEYVVVSDFNAVRIPPNVPRRPAATIGVAYVAAALSLGICMGVDFSSVLNGPNLSQIVRSVAPELLPADVRSECLEGIGNVDRAVAGDWLAIWGGSSTSANLALQLARLAGLKVVTIVDTARHGLRLANHKVLRPDLLVDSHDPKRAVDIIRTNVGRGLRFGLDTVGRPTATSLLNTLIDRGDENEVPRADSAFGQDSQRARQQTPPRSPESSPTLDSIALTSHLVGLTGLPKEKPVGDVTYHTVPIKIFHDVPAVGEALTQWLERLLESGEIAPPEVLAVEEGFDGVNRGLDRMRRGEIRGGRVVVDVA